MQTGGGLADRYPRETGTRPTAPGHYRTARSGAGVGRALAAAARGPPRRIERTPFDDRRARTCPARPQDVPPPRISVFGCEGLRDPKIACTPPSSRILGVRSGELVEFRSRCCRRATEEDGAVFVETGVFLDFFGHTTGCAAP